MQALQNLAHEAFQTRQGRQAAVGLVVTVALVAGTVLSAVLCPAIIPVFVVALGLTLLGMTYQLAVTANAVAAARLPVPPAHYGAT